MVDEHFDALDYADDDLNRQAIKLIREGIKDIISFVKFYLKKMISRFMRKTIYITIRLKGTHYKRMHPTLLKSLKRMIRCS